MTTTIEPYWDGKLMHLAERIQRKHGKAWWPLCNPPRHGDYYPGQVVGNATPTCLGCIARSA